MSVSIYDKSTKSLTPVAGNAEVNSNYSTAETFTGKYWIDGKKIYRKVIYIESLPDGSEITESNPTMVKAYAHNIADIDQTLTYNFFVYSKSLDVSFTTPLSSLSILMSYIDKTNIAVEVAKDRSEYSGYGIAEYTKTTD